MKKVKIRRDEAIKLIYDRTNSYQLDKMSDERLSAFLMEIGFGIDPEVPYYGWEFEIWKK